MNNFEVVTLVLFLFVGVKLINLLIMMILAKNINTIKKRKKGFLYDYTKMKLGENVFN